MSETIGRGYPAQPFAPRPWLVEYYDRFSGSWRQVRSELVSPSGQRMSKHQAKQAAQALRERNPGAGAAFRVVPGPLPEHQSRESREEAS